MPDIREDQHPKMWALLFASDRQKRMAGVEILSRIDLDWPVPWLALLIGDEDSGVAAVAYQALKSKGEDVLGFLKIQRLSPQSKVRQMVIRMLGELGDLDNLPDVIPALFDPFIDVREEGRKSIEFIIARALHDVGSGAINQDHIEKALRLFASLSTVSQINVRTVLVKCFLSLSVEYPSLYWELIPHMEPKARNAIEHEILNGPTPRHIDLLYFGLVANDEKMTERATTLIERLLNKDNVSNHVSSLTRLKRKDHPKALRILAESGLIGSFFEYFPWIQRALRIPFLQFFQEDFGERYSNYLFDLLEEANPHILPTLIDDYLTFNEVIPLKTLRVLLENPSPIVRRGAIRYLFYRGKQEAVRYLIPLVGSDDAQTARAALKAVSRISRDYLIDHFADLSQAQRRELTKTLQRTDEDFVESITELLVGLGDEERVQLTRILTEVAENPDALKVLESLAGDADEKVRSAVAGGLGMMNLEEVGAEQIDRLLNDPDPRVRANAIEALPLPEKQKRREAILLAAESESPRERANSIVALYQMGESNYSGYLAAMLRHPDSWMRTSGLWALSKVDVPQLLDKAYELCSDQATHVRKHAIQTIGLKGNKALAQKLTPWLSDPASEVREAANRAIEKQLGVNYRF
jgi:HEAT repeat protein